VLATHGVRQSISRRGDCFDHAVAEAFFATLEHELLADADFATRAEAHRAVAEFIEVWYNAERRHSTLGYVSPCSTNGSSAEWPEQRKLRVHQSDTAPHADAFGSMHGSGVRACSPTPVAGAGLVTTGSSSREATVSQRYGLVRDTPD
jgi:hypothetical protein